MKKYDVVALGELLVDFTENGMSSQGNVLLEANPGGCLLYTSLQKYLLSRVWKFHIYLFRRCFLL